MAMVIIVMLIGTYNDNESDKSKVTITIVIVMDIVFGSNNKTINLIFQKSTLVLIAWTLLSHTNR